MSTSVIVKMIKNEPCVIFAGSKTEANAKMFTILANSLGQIEKNDSAFGRAFTVEESYTELQEINGRTKSVVTKGKVTYYLQNPKDEN